jgi:DNA-binding NarL/FixJ family response regulator
MVAAAGERHPSEMDAASRPRTRVSAAERGDDDPRDGAITVVICDDVAALRAIVCDMLAECPGVEVIAEARTGRQCVALVAERKPDALLLDLSMPDMDGLEALPAIVASSPRTRIVVYSGFAAEHMRAAALERGAHLYVEKGTAPDELVGAIRALDSTGPGDRSPTVP